MKLKFLKRFAKLNPLALLQSIAAPILAAALMLTAFPAAGLAGGKVAVVATLPALASIAREVGGDRVSVTSLSLPSQDPHFVDARPSLALALNRADLLILAGLELEQGWLPTLLTGARNSSIQPGTPGYLDCSSSVALLGIPTGPVDRRMGDIHAGGNPHYLFAPKNALKTAQAVKARLSQLDPAGEEIYSGNLSKFTESLTAKIAGWEARMAPFKNAPIISYHSSWLYLADWLQLREIAFIEPKPGISPTPAHVTKVLAAGRREKVGIILQETFYADSTSKLIAEKIPAKLVKLPGGPDFKGGQSYADSMEYLISSIIAGLESGAKEVSK